MRDVTEYGALVEHEGCIRGCTVAGVHMATCSEWGSGATSECRGCAPAAAKDDAVVCEHCSSRLRRALEAVPDLVGLLHQVASPLKSPRLDAVKVSGSGAEGSPAPVPVDVLDALHDIMTTIGAGGLYRQTVTEVTLYRTAVTFVGAIIDQLDDIAADPEAFLEWWALTVAKDHPTKEGGWTVTGALARWPIQDRRRRLPEPCPECGLRTMTVTPPRHQHARAWFRCTECRWQRTEIDDDGIWAAAFGYHASPDDLIHTERTADMASTRFGDHHVDIITPFKAGLAHLEESPPADDAAPTAALETFHLGATPALVDELAAAAFSIAKYLRLNFKNGDLLAGGARTVAAEFKRLADELRETEHDLVLTEPAPEPEAVEA